MPFSPSSLWQHKTLSGAVALAIAQFALAPVTQADQLCAAPISSDATLPTNGVAHDCQIGANASLTIGAGAGVEQQDQQAAIEFTTHLGAGKTLQNNGTIAAVSTTDDSYGVKINQDLAGTLVNDRYIRAISSSPNDPQQVKAYGIHVGGDLSGSLTNNRAISAEAHNNTADTRQAIATGIYSNTVSGQLL